jgi:hypothetical protein
MSEALLTTLSRGRQPEQQTLIAFIYMTVHLGGDLGWCLKKYCRVILLDLRNVCERLGRAQRVADI